MGLRRRSSLRCARILAQQLGDQQAIDALGDKGVWRMAAEGMQEDLAALLEEGTSAGDGLSGRMDRSATRRWWLGLPGPISPEERRRSS